MTMSTSLVSTSVSLDASSSLLSTSALNTSSTGADGVLRFGETFDGLFLIKYGGDGDDVSDGNKGRRRRCVWV